jgi:hypothetical protein
LPADAAKPSVLGNRKARVPATASQDLVRTVSPDCAFPDASIAAVAVTGLVTAALPTMVHAPRSTGLCAVPATVPKASPCTRTVAWDSWAVLGPAALQVSAQVPPVTLPCSTETWSWPVPVPRARVSGAVARTFTESGPAQVPSGSRVVPTGGHGGAVGEVGPDDEVPDDEVPDGEVPIDGDGAGSGEGFVPDCRPPVPDAQPASRSTRASRPAPRRDLARGLLTVSAAGSPITT